MRKDERGHKIRTYEGHTGYVNSEIQNYFEEKYSQASFKVVPGHWPSMESKEDVDNWINVMEKLITLE